MGALVLLSLSTPCRGRHISHRSLQWVEGVRLECDRALAGRLRTLAQWITSSSPFGCRWRRTSSASSTPTVVVTFTDNTNITAINQYCDKLKAESPDKCKIVFQSLLQGFAGAGFFFNVGGNGKGWGFCRWRWRAVI